MNHKFLILTILCAGLVSCTKDFLKEEDASTVELKHYSIIVSSETNKTALQGDSTTIFWTAGDKISALDNEANYCLTTSESGSCVTFKGDAALSDQSCLLYPYNSGASFKSGTISTEFPLNQKPVINGFDPSAAFCVAKYNSKGAIQMHNAFAAFKLSLKQTDVVQVDITALGSVNIGGTVTITPTSTPPSVTAQGKCVSMKTSDGYPFAPGTYYLLAAPAVLNSGLKITFYYSDGAYAEKSSSTPLTLARNAIVYLSNAEENLEKKYSGSSTIDTYDFNRLSSKAHPRLFINKKDMEGLQAALTEGSNTYLKGMEKQIYNMAKKNVSSYKPITFKPYSSGLYFGDKLKIMLCMAYNYRKTGETRYLDYAVKNVLCLCDYPNWNSDESCKNKNIQATEPEYTPSTYLNTSALLLSTAVVYDWLYDDLTSEQRSAIVTAIKTKGFARRNTSDNLWWRNYSGNWNQVCNGALMVAALAIYTSGDTETLEVLKEAFKSNNNMIPSIYGNYGAYSEGPNYLNYGTGYQTYALSALETALGTDLGLSNHLGLQTTPYYKNFALANTLDDGCYTCFNYADCDYIGHPAMELWYFAHKFNNKDILFREVKNALTPNPDGDYSTSKCPPVALYYCYKLGAFTPTSTTSKLYTAQDGQTHLVMARTGWTEDDKYLGFKGGKAETTHAHMDAGEFIYESQGIRWAIDYDHPDYSKIKAELAKLGEGYFDTKQTSLRFQLITINCRAHNTLTVNNKDHCVSGSGTFLAKYDTDSELGGKMDLTPVFFNDLQSAVRKVIIKDGTYLQITDKIQTTSSAAAHIRFSLLTKAAVTIESDGIKLTQDGKSVKLAVTGCTPTYKQWSTDPSSSDWPSGKTRSFEEPLDANLCGFEYDIPAGSTISAIATIKDL